MQRSLKIEYEHNDNDDCRNDANFVASSLSLSLCRSLYLSISLV